ncbi:uncharacterized protein LOC124812053 isoform X3 [Hydra vulgaris]|uniref:uncharacterized protein LOC124812053 isoform X3 n=1 Tax=Hydra vulgaris TaxID=6087 RepID=UPI001F5E817B|nr:uncharacterized protein LOC124812053 isoform X3 [Hydra vulgaris]
MAQNNTYAKKHENILYSQEFKLNFSKSVGVDWKILGLWLNIEENCIDTIDHDKPNTLEKAYKMLTTWIQMNDNPTLEELKTALRNMNRIDLIRKIDELTKAPGSPEITSRFSANRVSLNPPDTDSKFCVKKDTLEICTALKKFYRENYGKVNEIQPPLKAPASVDLMDNFVDLCIVDAVNTQMDVVFNLER